MEGSHENVCQNTYKPDAANIRFKFLTKWTCVLFEGSIETGIINPCLKLILYQSNVLFYLHHLIVIHQIAQHAIQPDSGHDRTSEPIRNFGR